MDDAVPALNPSVAPGRISRTGLLFGGTLLILIAGGIGMQVWRARSSQAAEEQTATAAVPSGSEAANVAWARVNGEAITWETLARECVERHGKEVLENIINRTIIQQECSRRGITVSEAEVDQEILEISKKFGLALDQWYKMLEAERNLTPQQYRRDIIWPMLALRKLAGRDVEITEDMIRLAYEDNYGIRVKARMIVLDNIRRATEIWEKARKSPDDFESLARDYSLEPNSRALGGVIPPIRKNSGAHENLRKAAFAMSEPGEISGVLQVGPSQYAILKFEGFTEPVDHDMADVQAQLHADLTEREVQKMVGETFEKLQTDARIDNFLTGESRGRPEAASAEQATPAPAAPAATRSAAKTPATKAPVKR